MVLFGRFSPFMTPSRKPVGLIFLERVFVWTAAGICCTTDATCALLCTSERVRAVLYHAVLLLDPARDGGSTVDRENANMYQEPGDRVCFSCLHALRLALGPYPTRVPHRDPRYSAIIVGRGLIPSRYPLHPSSRQSGHFRTPVQPARSMQLTHRPRRRRHPPHNPPRPYITAPSPFASSVAICVAERELESFRHRVLTDRRGAR